MNGVGLGASAIIKKRSRCVEIAEGLALNNISCYKSLFKLFQKFEKGDFYCNYAKLMNMLSLFDCFWLNT